MFRSHVKYSYLGLDQASIRHSLSERMLYGIGKQIHDASRHNWYHALAFVVRDRLVERWIATLRSYDAGSSKRVYYFSLEFLIGRLLLNSLVKLDIDEEVREVLEPLGVALEDIESLEPDSALGNGGLGRLAACLLDSMATLRLPGFGYGIRYEYGMFTQRIEDGHQVEHPDNWLRYGNPWELPRPEVLYPVHFYGRVITDHDANGGLRHRWVDTDEVMAMAYDTLIPSFGSNTVNHLRLWSAKSSRDFNLRYFNEGNYIKAVEEKNDSENISRVLYPSDDTIMGRELRLQQEYFFVSAALQDILNELAQRDRDLDELPHHIAIQLNDTHPAIAVAELMRLLVDEAGMAWDSAWRIVRGTFSYTNHTLMPEALEAWPVEMMERMLPRHLQIIYEINHRFLEDVRARFPGDEDLVTRVSLIDETGERRIRMAHLAFVGSHRINGVSAIHAELMRATIFADLNRVQADKIINITNGITPRRWLYQCNRPLSTLIGKRLGQGWVTNLDRLAQLNEAATDAQFREGFRQAKQTNKNRLASLISRELGILVDPHSLFDVQIKRIHEYKRQLLNLLQVIERYLRICDGEDLAPRTVIFSGKAAPGYAMAKLIIKAINDVALVINGDSRCRDRLKLVFIPNYDVSTAADIIPAADLSEQISLAGTEASGTGNMKLALNGALTIGTLDGANIEICDAVGPENVFIFGMKANEVADLKRRGYEPGAILAADDGLQRILHVLQDGMFSPAEPARFRSLVEHLRQSDPYMVLADFGAYTRCQEDVDDAYRDMEEWSRRAILNVAGMGRFSSDRTIREYAERVWNIEPVAHE